MPLRLEIKRELSARSERVKCVDIHPTEPWVLAALFSGNIVVWNYATETSVKTFECCEVPVRSAKFIARKHWIICGADDMNIRVYNYNTMEKIKTFEAHADYIRGLTVHPTQSCVISASDDMSIKLWDWDKDWLNTQVYEGHTHYVMQVEVNPKDPNTFASASLDHSVKVWGLTSRTPHFSLEGHLRGVNCVSYFHGGDRPYLISGADDQLIKIWDYQTKSCVATLEGHSNNVSAVMFHTVLPLIISGSEDGTVRLWHSTTFRLENTLNYGMERVWSIACHKNSNKVAFGYDEGTIMIKIGQEEPVVSMDRNGKVVWAKNHDIIGTNVKMLSSKATIVDGERLPLATKEMGSCEIYPQKISHDPKARLLAVCGDGEYIIYTALVLKNKCFGSALEFVWASQSGMYATRESTSKVKIFKNFVEHRSFRPPYSVEAIFGGALLGMRSNDFVDFYDWETCFIVRRVEVCPRLVFWSESSEVLVIAAEASYFTLEYNVELVNKYIAQNVQVGEQGIDGSFELKRETGEHVITGEFVGDCFIYTNAANRLNYSVGGEVMTLAHLDKPYYLLGYLQKEDRVYLVDKYHNVVSFGLLLSVLIYETAIVRKDFEAARNAFESIPQGHHDKLARFLEAQGLHDIALKVTTDPEHKFELAVHLGDLQLASKLCSENPSDANWKALGDSALAANDLDLAKQCYIAAKDCGGLLFISSSVGDRVGVANLADLARSAAQYNVAFLCYFLLGKIDDCLNLLIETGRVPEAALMARTYAPSAVPRVVEIWRDFVRPLNSIIADSLADPVQQPELFQDYQPSLLAESYFAQQWEKVLPSSAYISEKQNRETFDPLDLAKYGSLSTASPGKRVPNLAVNVNFPSAESLQSKKPSPIRSASPSLSTAVSRSASPSRSPAFKPASHTSYVQSPKVHSSPAMSPHGSPVFRPDLRFPSPKSPEPELDLSISPSSNFTGVQAASHSRGSLSPKHQPISLRSPNMDSVEALLSTEAGIGFLDLDFVSPASSVPFDTNSADSNADEPRDDWMSQLPAVDDPHGILDDDQFNEFLMDPNTATGSTNAASLDDLF